MALFFPDMGRSERTNFNNGTCAFMALGMTLALLRIDDGAAVGCIKSVPSMVFLS